MMQRSRKPAAYGLLSLLLSSAALTLAAGCDRAALIEVTSRYVAAQSQGDIRYMSALAASTVYTENDQAANITAGILSKPLKIDHSRSIHDTAACATYTELIVADPAHPYVIGTQQRLLPATEQNGTRWSNSSAPSSAAAAAGLTLARVETIVTDAGDWLFNAQHTLHYALLESWAPIPPDQRDARETIRAAGDAYLDLFRNGSGSVDVPWAPDCKRLEGGLYTRPGDTCDSGVPSGVVHTNRRYVVDEVAGSVDIFLSFGGGDGNGTGLPDSHQFRVEKGRIRFVHTLTACDVPNCGFGAPPEELGQDVGY
ncbi:hypothetical protein VTK73DRAFT_242 [Phialemonium thermophilum]|uniref:DUF8021 domain-containing protein n=1 Tax=Phialemonium thermophilum TaxID=223376 RepID=A0ABR3VWA8_9PEZI